MSSVDVAPHVLPPSIRPGSQQQPNLAGDSDIEAMQRCVSRFTLVSQLRATVFRSWVNIFFAAVPVGMILFAIGANPVAVFVVNFIAIVPLADMLSFATEEIALRVGETTSGLLNATFGNVVELIVASVALVKGEVIIVQTSLIGSILSNLLLVMGMSFLFGGASRIEQYFSITVAQTASSLLALAVASFIIPTAFQEVYEGNQDKATALSRGISVLLLMIYGCYLFFQLKSHAELYNDPSQKAQEGTSTREPLLNGGGVRVPTPSEAKPCEEPEQPLLLGWVAVSTLVISTALVAVCAEFMVDSIAAVTATGAISTTFVGLILLPIVGNVAEHATAVKVACKDKMDLSLSVAVGSSMQIALFVLPLMVVIGWIMDIENMTLVLDNFQVIILFLTVLLVNFVLLDGKSHWLEGVILLAIYLAISTAVFLI